MTRSEIYPLAVLIAFLAIALELVRAASGASTTQPVPNGTDIAKLKLVAGTTYLVAKAAKVTGSTQLFIAPGLDNITIDGNGGTLTTEFAGTLLNIKARNFTLQNFALIDGGPETILATIGGDWCTIQNSKTADGMLKFACTVTGGTEFHCYGNHIGICGSVPVFVCTSGSHGSGNYFAGSWGEYCWRGSADTDKNGNAIYAPIIINGAVQKDKNGVPLKGELVRPIGADWSNNTFDNRCNLKGKPAIGWRGIDNVNFWDNTIYGYTRGGEPIPPDGSAGTVTRNGRCNFFLFHGNHFIMTGTASSAPTNAVQIMGGVTGSIYTNTFDGPADIDSPIAVATNNAVTIPPNAQLFAPGQKVQPLIAPTSDKSSYTVPAAQPNH